MFWRQVRSPASRESSDHTGNYLHYLLRGNCGTGVRASISKPTPFIYPAFEKTDPFIYLIIKNVDLIIYCPFDFCAHLLLVVRQISQSIPREQAALKNLWAKDMCIYKDFRKNGAFHIGKIGSFIYFLLKKGGQSYTGQRWKRGLFGMHVRTMPYIGSYSPPSPPPPPPTHTHTPSIIWSRSKVLTGLQESTKLSLAVFTPKTLLWNLQN